MRAEFCPAGTAAPLAALWYPAYWEDIEETPAHILLHTFSGQGYHYRQCFLENKFLPAEYDAIFPQGHDADDDAGHEVGGEFLPGVVLQGCEKCGSEFDHLRIFILRLILRLKNGGAKVVKMRGG